MKPECVSRVLFRARLCAPSDPLWDPTAGISSDSRINMIERTRGDLDENGVIDMKDISTITKHFGEHYP